MNTKVSQLSINQDVAEVVVPCLELDDTLSFFVDTLGFRIEMITPADNPNTAIISGYGVRLCLRKGGSGKDVTLRLNSTNRKAQTLLAPNGTTIEIVNSSTDVILPELQESLFVTSLTSEASWTVGRAGMRYRDLIPNRLGGAFIASHIHIPNGGPVPDYVHYHRIKFQMIYCKSGWVRVLYEDQGEPFVMNSGDCVLQPPEIRQPSTKHLLSTRSLCRHRLCSLIVIFQSNDLCAMLLSRHLGCRGVIQVLRHATLALMRRPLVLQVQ